MSEKEYADWLQAQFIIHKGDKTKNKAALAKALGVEPSAISKILNYSRLIKAHEYVIMRRFFGLPVDGEKAAQPHAVASSSNITSSQHSLSDSQMAFEPEFSIPSSIAKNSTDQTHKSLKSIRVTDHLMEPEFLRDSVVLIDPSDTTPHPSGVFAVSDKFTPMIRHCEFVSGSTAGKVNITALDRSFEPQVLKLQDFEILGRVIAKMEWVD